VRLSGIKFKGLISINYFLSPEELTIPNAITKVSFKYPNCMIFAEIDT